MKVGSLFSGVGGFDLALERAGMTIGFQSETDKNCQRVLSHHWPQVPMVGDIRSVDGTKGAIDVLCGGFPCQDVSVAGPNVGLAGGRSGLFYEFVRLTSEFAPRWVLIENVPGLLSSNKGEDMATVTGHLADLGYGWAYRVLDAQYFGVAQRRRRVFIVGFLGDAARPAKVLFEPESSERDSPPRREEGEELASSSSDRSNGRGLLASSGVIQSLTRGLASGGPDAAHAQAGWLVPERKVFRKSARAQTSDGYETWVEDGQANTLNLFDISPSRSTHAVVEPGTQGEGWGVRRLTPLECERLQGFPDNWTERALHPTKGVYQQSFYTRYQQMGNAVCVPVAEWIGRRIVEND